MKIKIQALSPLLCSTGESSAWIDADMKYDKYGFPYIQAKTFKGVLRESAVEVCEMLGIQNFWVEKLFGSKGNDSSGILRFNNLYIKGYRDERTELKNNPSEINHEFVKSIYTKTIQQTSIKDGVAKDKSLRKYRLIVEGTEFETSIENIPIDNAEFLELALKNLRYMGIRRNRGFGKIRISIENHSNILASDETLTKVIFDESDKDQNIYCISFKIETLDPVVIAKIFGEQNTVSTVTNVPGQIIRGLIAGLIIKNEKIVGGSASDNPIFRKIILDNHIGYYPAFVNNSSPVPKVYGFDKIKNDSPLEIIFDHQEPLKGQSGYGIFDEENFYLTGVETVFSFHHSRYESRLAGKSTEDYGAIFYYEGIDEDQIFYANITGTKSYLKYIEALLKQNNGEHHIGKARSAQYAKIKVSDFIIKPLSNDEILNSPVYVVFQSPVITYNKYGLAVPDLAILQHEIETVSGVSITSLKIVSSLDWVENYMGIWKNKTPREAAFDAGTTLRIEFDGTINICKFEQIGLGERKAEGYGKVKLLKLPGKLNRVSINDRNSDHPQNNGMNPFITQSMLFDLYSKQQAIERENRILIKAIEFAKPFIGMVPNSLLAKLRDKLENPESFQNWSQEMNHIKGKKAYRTLDNINLWDEILTLECLGISDPSPNDKKNFWIAALKTMRVKKQ